MKFSDRKFSNPGLLRVGHLVRRIPHHLHLSPNFVCDGFYIKIMNYFISYLLSILKQDDRIGIGIAFSVVIIIVRRESRFQKSRPINSFKIFEKKDIW